MNVKILVTSITLVMLSTSGCFELTDSPSDTSNLEQTQTDTGNVSTQTESNLTDTDTLTDTNSNSSATETETETETETGNSSTQTQTQTQTQTATQIDNPNTSTQTDVVTHFDFCLDPLQSGTTYQIHSIENNLVWDVYGVSPFAGADIIVWEDLNATNQQFVATDLGDDLWQFTAVHSDLALTIQSNVSARGGIFEQAFTTLGFYVQRDHANQPWRVIPAHSGLTLTLENSEPFSPITQQNEGHLATQRWAFNPVDQTCATSVGTFNRDQLVITSAVGEKVYIPYAPLEPANSSCVDPIQNGMYYHIENLSAAKSIDIAAGNDNDNTDAQLWGFNNGDHQTFMFESVGQNQWRIKVRNSGLYLSVAQDANADNTQVVVTFIPSAWRIEQTHADGPVKIVDIGSGRVLTALATHSAADLVVSQDSDTPLQRWFINATQTPCFFTGMDQAGDLQPLKSMSNLLLEEYDTGWCDVFGVVESEWTGFNGNGYSNTTNVIDSYISMKIHVKEDTTANIAIRYANASTDNRAATFYVNNEALSDLTFSQTATWDDWQILDVQLSLFAGENNIELKATGNGGLPNIDNMEFSAGLYSPSPCTNDAVLK
ncbi:RICIN domain-containing protein [Marinicellulosiphila megalodicopiae]|uniref:RICIN domain-containing protein n=1 Tax=Marinicellulosiphila megalodicopiae TaxID=2724896 RepID=UPI003BAEA0A6